MWQTPWAESRNKNFTLGDLLMRGVTVFDNSWDTYIPEHRQELIKKICNRYFFYEIGTDTPEKFIFYINAQLREIMPYYNQLYASELIKFNPMLNYALTNNTRQVENLVKVANTQNNAVAKAIKNFAETGANFGTGDTTQTVAEKYTIDKNGKVVYNKHGTEDVNDDTVTDKTTHNVTDRDVDNTETVTTHENKVSDGTERLSGSDTTNTTGNEVTKDTTTPNLTDKTVGTKGVVGEGTEVLDSTGKKTTETSGKSDEVTHLDETTTTHDKKDYSDTPQKRLDTNTVRDDYLTNVTWQDTEQEHTADGTKGTTYSETKTEDDKQDATTTKNDKQDTEYEETKTSTGDSVKDGTKDTTGQSVTDYGKVTTTHDTTVTDGTKDTVGHTDDKTVSDGTEKVQTAETIGKEWEEHGGENSEEHTNGVDDKTSHGVSKDSSQSSSEGRTDTTSSSGSHEATDEQRSTDTGKTDITSGYMNVSASSLMEAFRKTFLNVDEQIVNVLAENFMTVY